LNASKGRYSKKGGKNMIDPAVRTQEIKNRLDAVSARLHNIVSESDLFFADPRKTKTEVLECKALLDDIVHEIDAAFPVGGPAR
jgi:hypothetical protein